METTTDLRLVLSRELDTEELSLEHDTVVVSPELSRRVIAGLRSVDDQPMANGVLGDYAGLHELR